MKKKIHAYHLSSYDNFGTPLVIALLLNGEITVIWVRLIKTTLHAKTKLDFIDTTVKKPSTQSKEYHDWKKVDYGDDMNDNL